MKCYDCIAIHRQMEGEKGQWTCGQKGPTMGRTICETPASSCGDTLAHARALRQTPTPAWCPLNRRRKTAPRA